MESDRGIDYSLKAKGNNTVDNSDVTIGAETEDPDKTIAKSSNLSDSQRTLTDVKSQRTLTKLLTVQAL